MLRSSIHRAERKNQRQGEPTIKLKFIYFEKFHVCRLVRNDGPFFLGGTTPWTRGLFIASSFFGLFKIKFFFAFFSLNCIFRFHQTTTTCCCKNLTCESALRILFLRGKKAKCASYREIACIFRVIFPSCQNVPLITFLGNRHSLVI